MEMVDDANKSVEFVYKLCHRISVKVGDRGGGPTAVQA